MRTIIKAIAASTALLSAVLLIGLLLTPVRPQVHTAKPAVIVVPLDASLDQFAPMWQKEIGRRFDNAVGILVHGGDFVQGQWVVGTSLAPGHVLPVTEVVRYYQKAFPDRTIVLLACNTGHLRLGIPGVYYAHSSVWCVPDRQVDQSILARLKLSDGELGLVPFLSSLDRPRSELDPDIVGNIFEFVNE